MYVRCNIKQVAGRRLQEVPKLINHRTSTWHVHKKRFRPQLVTWLFVLVERKAMTAIGYQHTNPKNSSPKTTAPPTSPPSIHASTRSWQQHMFQVQIFNLALRSFHNPFGEKRIILMRQYLETYHKENYDTPHCTRKLNC